MGWAWTFDGERIVTFSDIIDNVPEAGYPCASWEEGIRLLNETGYISGDTVNLEDSTEITTHE
jgi:hypothetical protein